MESNYVQTLAAYATIKGMTDSEKYKNQYYILAEFVKYLIVERKLFAFSISKIITLLKEEFDFDIPYAVVRATLNRVEGLDHVKDEYTVVARLETAETFADINAKAEQESSGIIQRLREFAYKRENNVNEEELEQDFVRYVLDRHGIQESKYNELISLFVLSLDYDEEMQKALDQIREGNILYSGLNYNIINTGSITDELTLYLDTEVLFMIAGYDGELSKRIAHDLLDLIKTANKKGTKVRLAYFEKVKEEVDRFFAYACKVVNGKGVAISRAMASIANGCEHESDVLDKQSDFYTEMNNQFCIRCDEHKDEYYQEEKYPFNIESIEYLKEDEDTQEAIEFISHINVLRKGEQYSDYTKSRFILITETRRIQELSDQLRDQGCCGFSLPLSKITNILWVKLGSGFGERLFPYNAKIAVKARLVLDRSIASNVNKSYNLAIKQYKAGELTEEKTAARILRLREKLTEPENISMVNVDDLLDFSADSLQKYEDAVENSKRVEAEKDTIISVLKGKGIEKDQLIQELEAFAQKKDEIIDTQQKQLQVYQEKEKILNEKKQKKEASKRGILCSIAIAILAFIVYWSLAIIPENNVFRIIGRGLTIVLGFYGGACQFFPQLDVRKRTKRKVNSPTVEELQWTVKQWIIVDIIMVILAVIVVLFTKDSDDFIRSKNQAPVNTAVVEETTLEEVGEIE